MNSNSLKRLHRRSRAAHLLIAIVACGGFTACGAEEDPHDLEEHLEVLLRTPDDYPLMTRDEFVAAVRRRWEAIDGILIELRERGVEDELGEADSAAFERRLFELETSDADDAQLAERRAAISRDLRDLEMRASIAANRELDD